MKKIYSPCKDCQRRAIGCHSTCEDYIEYTNKSAEMFRYILNNKVKDEKLNNVIIGNREKRKKRRHEQ